MIIIILTATEPYKPRYAPDIFYAAAEKLNISPELCLVFEEGDQGLEAATKSWNADC